MDKTAQNELPPYCKDCTAAFAAFQKTFAETEKLYHYTSFESAIKILASHRLRYSQLKGLNDINESYRPACLKFNGVFPADKSFEDLENAAQQFRQISFTMDENEQPGFAIPAMWAHYAQKGNGVCLVFDKAKLERRLKSQSKHVAFQKICYVQKYDPSLILSEGNMAGYRDELFAKRASTFFMKTADWAYEQEYRVIEEECEPTDVFLDVKDAILAIILCNAPDIKPSEHVSGSVQYSIVQKIAEGVPICCYSSFLGERKLDCESNTLWSCANSSLENIVENLDV